MSANIPDTLLDLLTTDHIGHLATLRADGTLAPSMVWIDWDGEHILTSSPVGSHKGQHTRGNAPIALSVVDHHSPYRYLQIRGHVSGFRPDTDLAFIDRMAMRYLGHPYQDRDEVREIFEITVDHVRARGA